MPAVLALPLQRLPVLETHDNLSLSDVAALVHASLDRLEGIELKDANLAVEGARVLSGARMRPRHVAMPRAELTDDGFLTLVASGVLGNADMLDVTDCGLTSASVVGLADAPWSANLRGLDLSLNALDDDAVVAICTSRYLTNLEFLGLRGSIRPARYPLGERGVVAIETTANFGALQRLEVVHGFSPEHCRRLGATGRIRY